MISFFSADLQLLLIFGGWVSYIDSQECRIPDRFIVVVFIAVLIFQSSGFLDVAKSLVGLGFSVCQMLIVRTIVKDGIGLGDVKYGALIGSIVGLELWIYTIVLSCGFALLVLLPDRLRGKVMPEEKIPLAPYITCSAIAVRIAASNQI